MGSTNGNPLFAYAPIFPRESGYSLGYFCYTIVIINGRSFTISAMLHASDSFTRAPCFSFAAALCFSLEKLGIPKEETTHSCQGSLQWEGYFPAYSRHHA